LSIIQMIQMVLLRIFTAALVAAFGILSSFIALTILCGLLAVALVRIGHGFIDNDF